MNYGDDHLKNFIPCQDPLFYCATCSLQGNLLSAKKQDSWYVLASSKIKNFYRNWKNIDNFSHITEYRLFAFQNRPKGVFLKLINSWKI